MSVRDERQQRIRDLVVDAGYLRIDDLMRECDVSLMTIHRDLDTLQAKGWLRKIRGGATATPSLVFHGDLAQRMADQSDVKRALARAAKDLVAPGQTVFLDDSTTCLHLAQHLAAVRPLTVITNFLPVVKQFADVPSVNLVCLGGTYLPAYGAFLGLQTADAVSTYHADLLFMSTTAITRGRCYHQSPETVMVKRAMIAAADRRVLLIDHTKFSRVGLHHLCDLTVFDHIVVDRRTPRQAQKELRALGVPVTVV